MSEEWISADEELPPEGRHVLTFHPRRPYCAATRTGSTWVDDFGFALPVTHWMYWPDPPPPPPTAAEIAENGRRAAEEEARNAAIWRAQRQRWDEEIEAEARLSPEQAQASDLRHSERLAALMADDED